MGNDARNLALVLTAILAGCASSSADRPLRIGIRGSPSTGNHISALTYNATFQAQTLIYETLVKRDAEGHIVPGLASSWEFADGGRTVIFTLRPGARWHDGTPVTADDVRIHFKRWVGLPEFAWIHSSERIQSVVAESESRLRITMDRPHALLPDLCAIRPCAIGGPGCLDREGTWVKPVGSGPFRFVELREDGRVIRLERVRPPGTPTKPSDIIDLVPFDADTGAEEEPFALFSRGGLDVLIDGWKSRIPRNRIAELRRDPGLHLSEGPGSVLHYLSFQLKGPTADPILRRHVAAAMDRAAMIAAVEGGCADPCFAWAAPTIAYWPKGQATARPAEPLPPLSKPLLLLGMKSPYRPREETWSRSIVEALRRAGIPAEFTLKADDEYKRAVESGEYDLRTEITWGVPYDPDMSLKSRFLPAPFTRPTGASNRFFGVDPRAQALAERIATTPDEKDRIPLYAELQGLLESETLLVPLYVPRRVAVVRGRNIALQLDHDVYRDPMTVLTDQP